MKFVERVVTEWVYTYTSALLHTFLFIAWFALNLDINLLTLVVSLEAIYLAIGVGIVQRHEAQKLREHISDSTS